MPEQKISSIDTSVYVSNVAYGGSGGTTFSQEGALRGATVTSIQGWEGKWQLRGLKIEFNDGKSFMFGKAAESATGIFRFDQGETLVDLKFYDSAETSSGGYYRSGGFWFKTNKGRTFSATSKKKPGKQYNADVGSGPLCGVFGREGADIDSLGFAMLRPVKSAVLINVKYPGLETMPVATTPTTVDHVDYNNQTSVSQSLTLKGETTVQTKIAWSTTTSLEFSMTTTVNAGVPVVAQVNEELAWTVGSSSTYQQEQTETTKKLYDFPITCPPHTYVKAQAIMYEDQISTNYVADMTYHLDSGKVIKYHVKQGIYDGLSARGVYVTVEEEPIN